MATIEYRPYAEKEVTAAGWVGILLISALALAFFTTRKPI